MSVETTYESLFAQDGPWTEDDYFALPDLPVHVELVDGALLVTPLSSVPHARLSLQLTNLLQATCPGPGWEVLPGANVRLWQDHIRAPDVVVIRAGLADLKVQIPDVLLLAEITSPGNFRQDVVVKHADYSEAGVRFYLRVDLHRGIDALEAHGYELVDGAYHEYATTVDGVLRLERPWPLEADLRALARGRR